MSTYAFSHLSDSHLLDKLTELVAQDWSTTAVLVACIAEVDTRELYLPAAYPSMFAYCVHELRLSEDAAYKRIRAARTARRFPSIFSALADGRLNLTTVVLLTPYLTEQTADELLATATHKTKPELEQLLAERFPQSELLGLVEAVPASRIDAQLVPEPVGTHSDSGTRGELVPEPVGMHSGFGTCGELVPEPVAAPAPRSKVAPHASGRFAIHVTIGTQAHDDLRRAQELLSHQLPTGDVGRVLERALRLLVVDLEKKKLAATPRPQAKRRPTKSPRHIPAHVKRAVSERDGGQCTFVSDAGKRCPSRTRLEFDHVEALARGGEATVANLRLRCHPHNQFTAEREFGTEFMENKRQEARHAAEVCRAKKAQEARTAAEADDRDVKPWLRQLGYNAREASAAAAFCEDIPEASLEQRIRVALSFFRPRLTGDSRSRMEASAFRSD